MSDVAAWLRAELAADREQLAAMDAGDYVRSTVDTVLTPGLLARSMVHACVYAITHAEPGADSRYSLFERPLAADCWRTRDDLQASLLSVWVLGWVATPWVSLPSDPLLAAGVALQAVPLALDPVGAIVEVAP